MIYITVGIILLVFIINYIIYYNLPTNIIYIKKDSKLMKYDNKHMTTSFYTTTIIYFLLIIIIGLYLINPTGKPSCGDFNL